MTESVETGGAALAYRVDGDGPETLVLVNGLADTKETWELQLPDFAERYRVVSYDNRGVGESSSPPGPYTTAEMADDLAGLVDALELSRFHLLGVSMGGMIAQEYAIAHTDRLLSASFCCTYSYPGRSACACSRAGGISSRSSASGSRSARSCCGRSRPSSSSSGRLSSRRSRHSWRPTPSRRTPTLLSSTRSRRTTHAVASPR